MRAATLLLVACCLAAVLASSCVLEVNASPDLPAAATIVTNRGSRSAERSAGVCTTVPRFGSSWQDYCDHSGDYTYRVTFRDANCTIPSAVERKSSVLAAYPYERVTCENPKASPVQPLGDWPPVDWFVVTFNRDTHTQGWTCKSANGTNIVHARADAFPLGECVPRSVGELFIRPPTTGLFEAHLCAKDGLTSGKVLFSDSSCTTPVHARTEPTGCFHGYLKACPTNSTAAVALPTITRTNYYGTECDPQVGFDRYKPQSTDHFVDGLCLDGQRVQCVTDATTGVKSAVVTTYESENTFGACNTVKETNTYPVDACVQTEWDGLGHTNSAKFSCPSSP